MDSFLPTFYGSCHQLCTEMTDGKEVKCAFNQLLVILIEHWKAVKENRRDQIRMNTKVIFHK